MRRLLVFFAVLSLVLLVVLPACGGGNDEETSLPPQTTTPTSTSTSESTVKTATPNPITSSSPVKIGAITSWSGPGAASGYIGDQIIPLVEEQVKNQGGILGGRMVKFIKGDDSGQVSQSTAMTRKLILEDKVSMMTLGGLSGAHSVAVSNVCEELKVPYAAYTTVANVQDKKYTIELYGFTPAINSALDFLINGLKPKTVAILAKDDAPAHTVMDGIKEGLKAASIEVISDQYFNLTTVDFSGFLTAIKYKNPDILLSYLLAEHAITINKQILELGGWGTIKHFIATPSCTTTTIIKMPAAMGTYNAVLWLPGSDEPGMKAFGDAFQEKYGRQPAPEYAFFYNSLWTAIEAIKLANSDDPAEIAKVLRSGNLEWDSAYGPLRIPPNGKAEITQMIAQVQEGPKLAKVWP
jgi:branched-chain amino acid transport system substrate-binding protein